MRRQKLLVAIKRKVSRKSPGQTSWKKLFSGPTSCFGRILCDFHIGVSLILPEQEEFIDWNVLLVFLKVSGRSDVERAGS